MSPVPAPHVEVDPRPAALLGGAGAFARQRAGAPGGGGRWRRGCRGRAGGWTWNNLSNGINTVLLDCNAKCRITIHRSVRTHGWAHRRENRPMSHGGQRSPDASLIYEAPPYPPASSPGLPPVAPAAFRPHCPPWGLRLGNFLRLEHSASSSSHSCLSLSP